jgi:hypothetical protein
MQYMTIFPSFFTRRIKSRGLLCTNCHLRFTIAIVIVIVIVIATAIAIAIGIAIR